MSKASRLQELHRRKRQQKVTPCGVVSKEKPEDVAYWALLHSVRHVCYLANSVKVMYTGFPCEVWCVYLPNVPHTGHCVAGHATSWYCLSSTLTAAHWILIHICTPAKESTPGLFSITEINSLGLRLKRYMSTKEYFDSLQVELAKILFNTNFSV